MNCDFMYALAYFTADYHSGQFSRGYRLSCKVQKWIYKHCEDASPLDEPLGMAGWAFYTQLVKRYANAM
jgi:hypothetical protein